MMAGTGDYLQGVVSQNSVPENQQLVSGQIPREGPHDPLKCNAQPANRHEEQQTLNKDVELKLMHVKCSYNVSPQDGSIPPQKKHWRDQLGKMSQKPKH